MIDAIIKAKYQLAEGVCGLDLIAADGQPLVAFSAGAHIDIQLPSGLVRQYSLVNPAGPEQHSCDSYQIAVLKDPASRGGSIEVHEQLQAGQAIKISEPRNLFALAANAPHAVLVAGGIGITPILAMARELSATSGSFEVHYAARSATTAAYTDEFMTGELATHSQCYFNDQQQQLDMDSVLKAAPAGSHLYVCGPAGFIDYVLEAGRQQQWASERLHREFFAAPVSSTDNNTNNDGEDKAFEILIQSTGQIIQVGADESALEALEDAGIDINSSCESGICGSCVTRLIDGTPDHRDSFLNDEEKASNACFTPCCSRALGPRLVLDC
ncbi:PDR/VanB family oxidoreductase [Oceanobacter mangrovi]|uniref:PDR/VanB family oxidoreductase n=1 Tax=Oceanobacter mangrovi TaxID=2862510 RepID=UPI001C8DED5C|nr:PDR/VanB family oxidoreductase [Oceanobacter mangrovi]